MFRLIMLCLLTICLPQLAVADSNFTLESGETLTDPTKPADWRARKPAQAVARNFKLNYILNAKGRKLAMINGQRVSEGDYVSGAKVVAIRESSVTVLVDGRRQTLSLGGSTGIKLKK